MGSPVWEDLGAGQLGFMLLGADGNPVTLLKEVWDFKATQHANLEQNWDAFVETVEKATAVHESRVMPGRKLYYKHFPKLVREDGRIAQGHMVVAVDRGPTGRVASTYIPDHIFGKLGKRLWP